MDLEVGAGGREQGEEGEREGATSQEELGGGLGRLERQVIIVIILIILIITNIISSKIIIIKTNFFMMTWGLGGEGQREGEAWQPTWAEIRQPGENLLQYQR